MNHLEAQARHCIMVKLQAPGHKPIQEKKQSHTNTRQDPAEPGIRSSTLAGENAGLGADKVQTLTSPTEDLLPRTYPGTSWDGIIPAIMVVIILFACKKRSAAKMG